MIKAAFFDIDGTLLDHDSDGQMPESTRVSLQALQRKGIKVCVASGRAPFMLAQLQELFPFDAYVTLNGQYVADGAGQVLHTAAHDPRDIRALIPLAREKHISCMLIEGMESFPLEDDAFIRMMYGWLEAPVPPLYDLARLEEHPVLQFTAYLNHPAIRWPQALPLEEGVRALSGLAGVEVTSAGGGILDCIPRGGGKEVGIAAACARWGVKQEEVMVFGDGANDLRMLCWAGVGVAMGNADPLLKENADYVTDPVGQDGIRNALLRLGVLAEDELYP